MTRNRRLRVSMLAMLTVLASLAALPIAPASAGPGEARLEWLALGDSYSAGTGSDVNPMEGKKVKSDLVADKCQQYKKTYSNRARKMLVAEDFKFNYMIGACVGAQIDHYFARQPDKPLTHGTQKSYFQERNFPNRHVDIVTLSLGGNDLKFGDRVRECWDNDCDFTLQDIQDELPQLKTDLRALYRDVRQQMDPNGHIYVVGYPYIVSDPDLWGGDTCDRRVFPKIGSFGESEGRLLIEATDAVNDAIRSAVQTTGDSRLEFVDLRPLWSNKKGQANRGVCNPNVTEWMRGIDTNNPDQSYHPNNIGYRKIAELLKARIKADFVVDICQNAPCDAGDD